MIEHKEKWVIDTDPGTDDMMCLLYMLNRKDIEIKMISLVEGNTSIKNVQANIRKILQITNRLDIPVYTGSQTILYNDHNCNVDGFHGTDGLCCVPELMAMEYEHIPINPENASLKMIEIIEKNPNEINLLMIGPLTNLAVAYMMNPNILSSLKNFYTMGGAVISNGNINPAAEFNYAYDYIASKIIIPRAKNLIMIPWETIEEHIFNTSDFLKIKEDVMNSERSYCSRKTYLVEKVFEKKEETVDKGFMMCDLYAAMCIFNPNTVKSCFLASIDTIVDSDRIRGGLLIKKRIKIHDYEEGRRKLKENQNSGFHLVVEKMCREKIMKELANVLHD